VPDLRDLRVLLVLGTSTGGVGHHVRSLTRELGSRLAGAGGVLVAGPAETESQFRFTAVGARFVPVPVATMPRPPADARAVRILRRLVREVDVVHAHGLRCGVLTGLAVRSVRPRRPLVVTWHNAVLATGPRRRLPAGLEFLVARLADVTLGASPDLVHRARALGARDARLGPVAAAPLGEPQRTPEDVRAELGAAGRPLVLAVGRLAPQKGYPVLLDSARVWARRRPSPVVAVAGDGPLREPMLARIEAERLPVRLLGHRDDVPDLLAAADVVVLPSRWEARALVAQEALRAGRPLVATAVGGVPELVGDAACLVPYGDAAALARTVGALLDDPAAAERLAARGPAQAARWPDEAAVAEQVLTVYGEVLGSALR
jgi:glycosyltransferase involved in cell wall biosynthesis